MMCMVDRLPRQRQKKNVCFKEKTLNKGISHIFIQNFESRLTHRDQFSIVIPYVCHTLLASVYFNG